MSMYLLMPRNGYLKMIKMVKVYITYILPQFLKMGFGYSDLLIYLTEIISRRKKIKVQYLENFVNFILTFNLHMFHSLLK